MASIEQQTAEWVETTGDRFNPLLVKETRQSLKSRQFIASFLLLLTAAWLVSSLGVLMAGDRVQYGSISMVFFLGYYAVLAFAVTVIVPYTAFRSLISEMELNTFDLMNITTLTPRQIIWGKHLSATVQTFIYFSAITPFVAFTSLLQGFDLPKVLFLLFILLLASLCVSMVALTLAALAKQKRWQVMTSIALLVVLIVQSTSWIGLAFDSVDSPIPFDRGEFWAIFAIVLTGVASYFALFHQIASSQLTFESGNRSTGIRVVCLAQFMLVWLVAFGFAVLRPEWVDYEGLSVLAVLTTIHLAIVGLFVATEGDHLSRRVQRELPQSRFARLLSCPLQPGGSRGYMYFVLQVAALWGLVFVLLPLWGRQGDNLNANEYLGNVIALNVRAWPRPLQFVTAACCYLMIYIGMGNALGRWLMNATPIVRPIHTRVFTLLLVATAVLTPPIIRTLEFIKHNAPPTILDLMSPYYFVLVRFNAGNQSFNFHMLFLMFAAVIVTGMNLPAMYRGLDTIINADSESSGRSEG